MKKSMILVAIILVAMVSSAVAFDYENTMKAATDRLNQLPPDLASFCVQNAGNVTQQYIANYQNYGTQGISDIVKKNVLFGHHPEIVDAISKYISGVQNYGNMPQTVRDNEALGRLLCAKSIRPEQKSANEMNKEKEVARCSSMTYQQQEKDRICLKLMYGYDDEQIEETLNPNYHGKHSGSISGGTYR